MRRNNLIILCLLLKYSSINLSSLYSFFLGIFEYPYPGKSTNLNLSSSWKSINDLVLPGVFEILAIFDLSRELIKKIFQHLIFPKKLLQDIIIEVI